MNPSPNMKDNPISITNEVFAMRMICLLETAPQSCKYYQLLFTPEQFIEISTFIQNMMPPCTNPAHVHGPHKCIEIPLEDSFTIEIKQEVRSAYPKEYIDS